MTALAPLAPAGTGTEQPEPTPPAGGARSRLGILVLPALLMFLAFAFVPLIGVLVLSFTDWDGIGAIQFVGGQSWSQVLTDPGTWHALYLTFAVMIITWLVQTPISLLLGTFIAGQQRYRAFLAVLFFLPLLMASAAIAIAFKSLLDPNFGLSAGLHGLRDPAHGVDLEQLHPRRTPRAVRVHATRRLHGLADGVEAGVSVDAAGNRDRRHLQRPARLERIPLRPDLDPEPREARDAAGVMGVPGRVQREHPGRAGRCGAVHSADLGALRRRSSPTAAGPDGGIW